MNLTESLLLADEHCLCQQCFPGVAVNLPGLAATRLRVEYRVVVFPEPVGITTNASSDDKVK